MPAILKRAADLKAYRISAGDSNHMACLFYPIADGVGFTAIVEIFEPGGRTPPNTHLRADEMFFVLRGSGVAIADGERRPIGPGDALVLRPGTEHVVENTGDGRLYCLTVMVPDEDFAALIRGGTPVALDAADIAVLTGVAA